MAEVAEITYDLVMDDDMDFVEGCYGLPGRPWEVFTISKSPVAAPEHEFAQWDSGVIGVAIHVPKDARLNKAEVERLLSSLMPVTDWHEVRGPDSIMLR